MKKSVIVTLLSIILFSCVKPKTISSEYTKIEENYTSQGSYSTKVSIIKDNNGNNKYVIYYPSSLSESYPLITWGNGTGMGPSDYSRILQHLASWGYIVIDNFDGNTANGASILQSVRYMIQENNNSSSIFYHKIIESKIAASGHSQGAGGIVNALTEYDDGNLIKTLVPVAYPSLIKSNPANINVPIFFISGTEDKLFSTTDFNIESYRTVRSGVPTVMAIRKTANHDAIIKTDQESGYLTAWMQYQLKGDSYAKGVFSGSDAEIFKNPNWKNVATKSNP